MTCSMVAHSTLLIAAAGSGAVLFTAFASFGSGYLCGKRIGWQEACAEVRARDLVHQAIAKNHRRESRGQETDLTV